MFFADLSAASRFLTCQRMLFAVLPLAPRLVSRFPSVMTKRLTPALIRAARGYLGWTQTELAQHSGLALFTIQQIESGRTPRDSSLERLEAAFEPYVGFNYDVGGIQQRGVRGQAEILNGPDALERMMEIVRDDLRRSKNGWLYMSGVVEDQFRFWLGREAHAAHHAFLSAMKDKLDVRLLLREGDRDCAATDYASYRWTPKNEFAPFAFCVSNRHLGLMFLEKISPQVFLLEQPGAVSHYRSAFEALWEKAIIPDNGTAASGRLKRGRPRKEEK